MCVCVCERERERERECVCVCACVLVCKCTAGTDRQTDRQTDRLTFVVGELEVVVVLCEVIVLELSLHSVHLVRTVLLAVECADVVI